MVVKIYVSRISGNKDVKKQQQRIFMILDSKNIKYETIDISEPGREDEKKLMQDNSNPKNNKHPLPPQIFFDDDYCGDYEDFDAANELDELEKFLKPVTLDDSSADEPTEEKKDAESNNIRQNGNASREASTDKDVSMAHSESGLNERESSMADDDNEIDKSNSEDLDKTTKSAADNDSETDDIEDKNEEKSDEQEKEE